MNKIKGTLYDSKYKTKTLSLFKKYILSINFTIKKKKKYANVIMNLINNTINNIINTFLNYFLFCI